MARRAARADAEPGAVFAVARAVVCGWWEQEAFRQREQVWGRRLERVVVATSRRHPAASGRPDTQWRLMGRDAVASPEVVTVTAALVDPALRPLTAGPRSLVPWAAQDGHFVAALGDRLGRGWLGEAEPPDRSGALQAWLSCLARACRSPSLSGAAHRGMWWVQAAHRLGRSP